MTPTSTMTGLDCLTPREREVEALIGEGLTRTQIAVRLFISLDAVDKRMQGIKRKRGIKKYGLWHAIRCEGA